MVVCELVLFLLNNIFVRSLVIVDLGLPALASVLRTKPLTLNFLLPSDSLRRGFPVAILETTSADLQQAAQFSTGIIPYCNCNCIDNLKVVLQSAL